MSRISTMLIAALAAAACTTPGHSAENLAARVAAAPDGTVSFNFPARAGVCGDGATFIAEVTGPNQQNFYTSDGTYNGFNSNFQRECVDGPVRVVLEVRNGRVLEIRPYVGPSVRTVRTDLGAVMVQEATDYLVALGGESADHAARAFMAASLGEGSRISVPLVKYAGNRGTGVEVRESAIKWIGRTAEREGTADEVLPVLRKVMQERDEHLELRERALRAIGEFARGDAELRGLYAKLDAPALRERALRIFAEVGGRTNEEFIKNAALDRGEDNGVRERAIRLLGDELGQLDVIRDMYDRLEDVNLRERAVRSVADNLSGETAVWVRGIAENANEDSEIRQRAVRTLGEAGYSAQLRAMFARVNDAALKDRIVRVVGEHGSEDDRRWIESVAGDEKEALEARDRALRVLAESGIATARMVTLYDQMESYELRDRVLRLLGERADDMAIEKLVSVARNGGDADLRRRAARLLGESDHPRARDFLRTTVLQR